MKSMKRAPLWGLIGCTLITIGLFIHSQNKCAEITRINNELTIAIEECQETISILNAEKQELEAQVIQLQKKIQAAKTIQPKTTTNKNANVSKISNGASLGQFKISAYCHCSKCCGKSDGITATGAKATANRTQ